MGMGIDLIHVKFKKKKDLNFFFDFFNKLAIGQLPDLNKSEEEYFPYDYRNKILTFLGYSWGFMPDTPDIEKLEIDKEKLILRLTVTGLNEGWATIELMKCMLKRIKIAEYTHYGTHTSTCGTDLNWLRNNEEFKFSDEGVPEEFYNQLGDDNFTEENYFKLLFDAIENSKLNGKKFQTRNVEQIDELNRIKEGEHEIMLKKLVNYLKRLKDEPNEEQKIFLRFYNGNLTENINRLLK